MSTTTAVTSEAIEALQAQLLEAQRLYALERKQTHEVHPDAQSPEALKAVKARVAPMPHGVTVAMYLRISDDRAGAGLGVERQRFDVDPLLAQHFPGQPVHLYVDNDLTASGKVKRPAYQQLLADMAAGKVKAILAWHPDRVYRNPTELELLIKLVDDHRVAIKTAKHGELDLSTPTGRLVARLLGGVAMYELEHQRERVMGKKDELARDGKPAGGPRLFGYTKGFHVDPDTGTCVVATEAAAAQTVVAALLAGASLRSQVAWLNAQDDSALVDKRAPMLGSRGKPWTVSSLRAYVQRPALAAIRVHKAGTDEEQSFPAIWPALITQAQHDALVHLFSDPLRKKAPGHGTRKHLLTGIARCGVCGGRMQAATEAGGRGKPRYGIYRCKANFCINRKQDRVDAIVLRLTGAWLAKQSPQGLLTDPGTDAEKARLTATVTELKRKLQRIEDDYDAELLSGAERKTKQAPLAEKLAVAERALLSLQAPATVLDGLLGQDDALELLKALPLSRQRAVISAIGVPVVMAGHRHQDDFSVARIDWHKKPQI
jgi:site-specific DNA recombinase